MVANYGIGDRALVQVLFGDGDPTGNLPFDVPRSMDAVLASRTNMLFVTADPVLDLTVMVGGIEAILARG